MNNLVAKCISKYWVTQSRAAESMCEGYMWRADCYLRAGAKLLQFAGKLNLDLTLKLAKNR